MYKKIITYLVVTIGFINLNYGQNSINKDFILIGNKTDLTEVSTKKLIQIFKAKYSSWNNGEQVTIVLPSPDSNNANKIAYNIYNTSVSGVQKFWLSQVFQGRGYPPVFLDTDDEIIKYVSKTPGAIGLIKFRNNLANKDLIISMSE